MATGPTGSERSYPNSKTANKGAMPSSPGGRTYPGGRASPAKSADVKKQSVGNDAMPPGAGKPDTSCNSEYRQERSKRSYAK